MMQDADWDMSNNMWTSRRKPPIDHQSLFLSYIDSLLKLAGEFSGDIRESRGQVRDWADEYAFQHNLQTPDWSMEASYENYWGGCEDPYESHEYCPICHECTTCNIRWCRDGAPHPTQEKS